MKTAYLPVSFAPQTLIQPINPWTMSLDDVRFSVFSLNVGQTSHPECERRILDDVGSYGRQLGRIGDVLEVLMNRLPLEGLTEKEADALAILRGQLAEIRKVKAAQRDGR